MLAHVKYIFFNSPRHGNHKLNIFNKNYIRNKSHIFVFSFNKY